MDLCRVFAPITDYPSASHHLAAVCLDTSVKNHLNHHYLLKSHQIPQNSPTPEGCWFNAQPLELFR